MQSLCVHDLCIIDACGLHNQCNRKNVQLKEICDQVFWIIILKDKYQMTSGHYKCHKHETLKLCHLFTFVHLSDISLQTEIVSNQRCEVFLKSDIQDVVFQILEQDNFHVVDETDKQKYASCPLMLNCVCILQNGNK